MNSVTSSQAWSLGATGVTSPGFSIAVADDIGACEAEWRQLERRGTVSAYQDFAFNRAWVRHVAPAAGVVPRIGIVRDSGGRIGMILPFGMHSAAGIKVGTYLGGTHVNLAMPLLDPDFASQLSGTGLAEILRRYCAHAGIDVLALRDQPKSWMTAPHPFLPLPLRPAPHDVLRLVIDEPPDSFLRAFMSRPTKKKLRQKEGHFSRAGFTIVRASTKDEARRYISAFMAQKSRRFAEAGISNRFDRAGVREFLVEVADESLAGKAPLTLIAMRNETDILAVCAYLSHGSQQSQLLRSVDAWHPLSRYSPGEVMRAKLIAEDAASGIRHFDFGVGEEKHKISWSNARTALFDTTFPVTTAGRCYAVVEGAQRRLARAVKQNRALYGALKAVRRRIGPIIRV
jgi:CelD/BcsL family acetyltransferase involved in cellulose biosynthesis